MSSYPNQSNIDTHSLETVVRSIFPAAPIFIERVTEGVSTYVYRVTCQQEIFYLRILPEEGASFAPEAAAHAQLRQLHAKVPAVIYMEPYNDLLRRSIMVTTAIAGQPVSRSSTLSSEELQEIMKEAGCDLARINSVSVEGFGWVERNVLSTRDIQAKWPTYRAFALEFWEADLTYLGHNVISASEVAQLECMLSLQASWLVAERASLAHGDFDLSHIYQEDGHYTGIIDFGEICGTDCWYDLGHFHVHDGEQLASRFESALLQGYGEIATLPPDYEDRILFASLLINVRVLARSLQKRPSNRYTQHLLEVLRHALSTWPYANL